MSPLRLYLCVPIPAAGDDASVQQDINVVEAEGTSTLEEGHMTWHYAIIRFEGPSGPYFSLHEVYRHNGRYGGMTLEPIAFNEFESAEELTASLALALKDAQARPIMNESDFGTVPDGHVLDAEGLPCVEGDDIPEVATPVE